MRFKLAYDIFSILSERDAEIVSAKIKGPNFVEIEFCIDDKFSYALRIYKNKVCGLVVCDVDSPFSDCEIEFNQKVPHKHTDVWHTFWLKKDRASISRRFYGPMYDVDGDMFPFVPIDKVYDYYWNLIPDNRKADTLPISDMSLRTIILLNNQADNEV